ncbi:hypothetical protein NE237_011020 [Protea cynaroides]|uniref:Transcriptional regulator SLK2 n=1 Tax=Protea cynaroides TaxID=273540 RepID=A0A9Q0GYC8_9MAGN|nr:hypothetical protein NE237_011020 [Protea cynaroides]
MNRTVLNSTANSGPSVGASSLVTDANSALSGGPHLQRSASTNTESYLRLPASPMSFSSNNISISGSSVIDGSSIVQQSSHQEHVSQHVQQRQQQQHGASSDSSQPPVQTGPASVPSGPQVPSSLTQEPNNLSQMHKKPRLDVKQEDILQQQVFQQYMQRPDSMQSVGHNPQLQAMIQQQRLWQQQQQQIMQSVPQMQRAHLQQQQQQLRHHLQQQGLQSVPAMKRPYENGICARRLMQYLYHHRHRPPDNSIVYWRKFVQEYFAPRSKKRWCLSLYDNVGLHALGVFPQAAMDAWRCDICGSKSGRGFEATFEVLPRLNKIKFDSGVIDELLYVDLPRECRFPSGLLMLEYGKAVQESVYEQLRVVREGQLRIIFTSDLKILSWEFCARHHEELFPRRVVTPQVNQLLQVAQKIQNSVAETGSATGLSTQDLQTNCNMFLTAGRQLARNLELQSLNDLGFSKRYVRCLQIAEVVNSMKDLLDFSEDRNVGPIESLKTYPRQATAKLQMQKLHEIEQLASAQGLPTDRNTLSKIMVMHPSLLNNHTNSNHMVGSGVLNGSAHAAVALSNYQNLLRQSSMNSNSNVLQEEASFSYNGSNQAQSSPFQGPVSLPPVSMQNIPVNGLANPHLQQQQQSMNTNNNLIIQQSHPQSSLGNQNLPQHMIQQMLQEMMSSDGAGVQQQQSPQQQQQPQQPLGGQRANGSVGEDVFSSVNRAAGGGLEMRAGGAGMVSTGLGFGNNSLVPVADTSVGGVMGMIPKRSNSFKAANNSNSSVVSGTNSYNQRAPDMPQNLRLPEMVQDMSHEYTENGVFNTESRDMSYGWKA